ncbi:hypothetical protein Tco_0057156, partial [Tanacetum coccineum]
ESAGIADFPEGKVGVYTRFFEFANQRVPLSLFMDERPPPGSYSMEDAELIKENRIPINAYSEAFLCHMGISHNYFQSPEEVPTFIGNDGRGAAVGAQLRARLSNERGQSVQKDEEILLLKTQLADAQAEAESSRSYAQKLVEEKMALLVKVEQERANSADYKASCHWVVKCALARGKVEAVEELHEKKLLTVPAAQVPGYNDNAYEELVAAMETMKLLELPHIAQLERDQDYLIDVILHSWSL